jgi:hypothetical protein
MSEQGPVSPQAEDERRRMGAALGIGDECFLVELQQLGYNPETIHLLHLVPLIAALWAESDVSLRERDLMLRAAELRGVTPDTGAYRQLESWLTERPSDEFLSGSLQALRAVVATLNPGAKEVANRTVVDYCVGIVRLTGGLYGVE